MDSEDASPIIEDDGASLAVPDPTTTESVIELPGGTKAKLVQVTGHSVSMFSGPLPRPDVLAEYEHVLPGAAERIIRMAENQAAHRQGLERCVVRGDSNRALLGLIFAFVVVVIFSWLAYYLFSRGAYGWGAGILGADLLALVVAFNSAQRQRSRQLAEGAEAMENPEELSQSDSQVLHADAE